MHFIEEILEKKTFLQTSKLDGKSLEECLFELGKIDIDNNELIHWEIAFDYALNWNNVESFLFENIQNCSNNETSLSSSSSLSPSSSSLHNVQGIKEYERKLRL